MLTTRPTLLEWESLCLSVDLDTRKYTLMHRQQQAKGCVTMLGQSARVRGEGVIVVGREQHQYDGGLTHSLRGSLTHLTVLGDALLPAAMLTFLTDCSWVPPFPLFGLSVTDDLDQWERRGNILGFTEPQANQFCLKLEALIMLPSRHTQDRGSEVCHNLGGSLVRPSSSEEDSNLQTRFSDYVAPCTNSYGSWVWVDAFRKFTKVGLWSTVWKTFPVRKKHQCLSLSVAENNTWLETPCEEKLCTVCHVVSRPQLTLRGGCRLPEDRHYTFTYDDDGHPSLKSARGVMIVWDRDRWVVEALGETNSIALQDLRSSFDILPLGITKWRFSAAETDCLQETQLLLSVCDLDQFACSDGMTCVPWRARCDMLEDCTDGTDEKDCHVKSVTTTGEAYVPPPPLPDEAITITMSLHTITMKEMDLSTSRMVLEISLRLSWKDPRVTFYNLHPGENTVGDAPGVWTLLVGGTTTGSATTNLTIVHASLTVTRPQDTPRGSLLSQDVEYNGGHSGLGLWALYTVESKCDFDLRYFPFDTQRCRVTLSFKNLAGTEMRLVKTEATREALKLFIGQTISGYKVEWSRVEQSAVDGVPAAVLSLRLAHGAGRLVAVIHVPTLLLLLLQYCLLFLSVYRTTVRMGVGVACLVGVVLVFWGSSLAGYVPDTPSTTFLHVWFIFTFVFAFCVVFVIIVTAWGLQGTAQAPSSGVCSSRVHPQEAKECWSSRRRAAAAQHITNNAHKINTTALLLLGVGGLIVVIWYFATAINHD
ncbi:uncharacterized protein [Panulirus ornatus]